MTTPRLLPPLLAGLLAAGTAVAFFGLAPESVRRARATDYTLAYRPVAETVVGGGGLMTPDGVPATKYPPGYSLLLAGTYWAADRLGWDREAAVDGASGGWFVLGAVALWGLASLVWGRWPAVGAAALWCLYPPAVVLLGQAGSELPFIPVLFATLTVFWVAARRPSPGWRPMAAAGAGCAALMLLRPIALGLPAVLGLYLLAFRAGGGRVDRLRAAAVLGLAAAAGVAPWQAHLYAVTGRVAPLSTNGPANIYIGLTFAVREDPDRAAVALPAGVLEVQRQVDADWQGRPDRTEGALLAALARAAADRPAAVAQLVAVKAARCWYATDSRRHETALALLGLPYAAVVAVAAVRTARRGGSRGRAFLALVAAVVLYNWLMATLALSILRYMVPAIGLLFALVPALWTGRAGPDRPPA